MTPSSSSSTEPRSSLDSETNTSPPSTPKIAPSTNGHMDNDSQAQAQIQALKELLQRTTDEKETLAMQYNNLLAKLTAMRTTLGNKLKQDAEELDRREQLLQQLTAQNEDLTSTVETLKEELVASNHEAERAHSELDHVRSRTLLESTQESMLRERELRESQTELERCRMERDEWERTAQQERLAAEESRAYERDLEHERDNSERLYAELEAEKEKSANLQSVLQDFQAAKDHELRQAVKELEAQLTQTTQALAEFKSRALNAELQLEETQSSSSRVHDLEKEVKEKNLLIGKLRHEAVIINEHLMEALRRLRRNSSEVNVDRRLVSNVLLSFLTTPRGDAKRFEMLGLLATVLSWSDAEREKAGLQRTNTPVSGSGILWGRSPTPAPKAELEKSDETESFSRLWVEFLLTESSAGTENTPPPKNVSLPGSPTVASHNLSPSLKSTRRIVSSSSSPMTSSPNLTLGPPPSRKGKEKEITT
ncbi:hypothetical protein EYR40_010744 [Pleurotus pulmonarius]|nr:hypothetical protein EYR36_002515 [Pleurotus pulmonarius]KAF4586729.1 hypothetical protein EYR40_010744 [Pleurotus pulmonarius]